MSRFTPGPWRILEKSRKMRSSIEMAHCHGKTFTIMGALPQQGEGSQYRVGVVDGPSNRDLYSACTANARLIAAAPELLEALELAVATIRRLEHRHGPFSSSDGTLNVAADAIAKATGQ
jgi:hypothetical protein